MSEHPIIFNSKMVRAILDGRKTQMRRVIKQINPGWVMNDVMERVYAGIYTSAWGMVPRDKHMGKFGVFVQWQSAVDDYATTFYQSPYGNPGDTLWVRETWALECPYEHADGCGNPEHVIYRADYDGLVLESITARWRPSIHMPRWASRITLEIVDVRVERVHDISDDDAYAEGITQEQAESHWYDGPQPVGAFGELWDRINQARGYGWDVNPWVWVVEFRIAHEIASK